jgi:hypothetical protein
MTTVVFVHGTGVREPEFGETFDTIKRELLARKPGVKVAPCYWGEPYGTKLRHQGASVPEYASTMSVGAVSDADYLVVLWGMLYQDPLYELRTLALQSGGRASFVPGQQSQGDDLKYRAQTLQVSAALEPKLEAAGIADVFDAARTNVTSSAPFLDALRSAPQALGPYRTAIGRAIVAAAIDQCAQQDKYPPIAIDADLRDDLATSITQELGASDLGLGSWAGKQLVGLALRLGAMNQIQRRRGAITDASFPMAGDVLLYQGRGDEIRAYIRGCVKDAAQTDPAVVLLAHSLGGIACVDLLAMEALPEVKLLVTVGSQAPFLYEIGALHSLRYNQPLPPHFPRWINIYDLRDFLSYIGAGVFVGRVQDVPVDNRQPFPHSHGAYWTNRKTWETIVPRIP